MKLSDGSSSNELLFGNISQGTTSGSSSGGWTLLFDAHQNGKQLGKLAWRYCAFIKIRRYMAICLKGVAYETVTFEIGGARPWRAEFFRQGKRIGTITEMPWPELGWFRKQFLIRNFERTFEVRRGNGDNFAQFSFEGLISSRTVIRLEVFGANTTIDVALADSLFEKKASHNIIGAEIDSLEDTLSKELCFIVSMWIRFQLFQLGM